MFQGWHELADSNVCICTWDAALEPEEGGTGPGNCCVTFAPHEKWQARVTLINVFFTLRPMPLAVLCRSWATPCFFILCFQAVRHSCDLLMWSSTMCWTLELKLFLWKILPVTISWVFGEVLYIWVIHVTESSQKRLLPAWCERRVE